MGSAESARASGADSADVISGVALRCRILQNAWTFALFW
jgi:hypothetical protein